MGLKPINDCHIDVTRISYIGPLDKHVKHGIQKSNITYYFLVIVDGHPIEIQDSHRETLEKNREKLIDELNRVDGYLPA